MECARRCTGEYKSGEKACRLGTAIASTAMAPVATAESNAAATNGTSNGPVKAAAKASAQLFNPFYSPDVSGEGDDSDYQYAKYKVRASRTIHTLPHCHLPSAVLREQER